MVLRLKNSPMLSGGVVRNLDGGGLFCYTRKVSITRNVVEGLPLW